MTKKGNAMVLRKILRGSSSYPVKFTFKGTRCRMYINGFLVGSRGGVDYDMRGACLAEFLYNAYTPELKALWERVEDLPDRPYGIYEGGYINGRAGLNCMIEIAGLIGLEIWWDCEMRSYWIRSEN